MNYDLKTCFVTVLAFLCAMRCCCSQDYEDVKNLKAFKDLFAVNNLNRDQVENILGFSVAVLTSSVKDVFPVVLENGQHYANRLQNEELCYQLSQKEKTRISQGRSRLRVLTGGASDDRVYELDEHIFSDELECLHACRESSLRKYEQKKGTSQLPIYTSIGIVSPFEYSTASGFAVESQVLTDFDGKLSKCIARQRTAQGTEEFFILTVFKNTVLAFEFMNEPEWLPSKLRIYRSPEGEKAEGLTLEKIHKDWKLQSTTSTVWRFVDEHDVYVPDKITIADSNRHSDSHYTLQFKSWKLGDAISGDFFTKERFGKEYLSALDYPRLRGLFSDVEDPFKKDLSKRE